MNRDTGVYCAVSCSSWHSWCVCYVVRLCWSRGVFQHWNLNNACELWRLWLTLVFTPALCCTPISLSYSCCSTGLYSSSMLYSHLSLLLLLFYGSLLSASLYTHLFNMWMWKYRVGQKIRGHLDFFFIAQSKINRF